MAHEGLDRDTSKANSKDITLEENGGLEVGSGPRIKVMHTQTNKVRRSEERRGGKEGRIQLKQRRWALR